MAISTTIPESWRLPLFWAVVDGSQAGNLIESHVALLVRGKVAFHGPCTAEMAADPGLVYARYGEG